MCRSIKTLRTGPVPASDEEITAAALQFVRKVSGYHKPSALNREAFDRAVGEVAATVHELLGTLVASGPPKDREVEAARARARNARRFPRTGGEGATPG